MKANEEITEFLAAYDLTGSYRKAAELAGCDHHTVRRYVQLRGTGHDPAARVPRAKMMDAFLPKIEELVEKSHGKIGADQVHKILVAMGFTGTDRTTRRAVAAAKESYRTGYRRVHRPWVTEPALWMRWDWGEGPPARGSAHVAVVRVVGMVEVPGSDPGPRQDSPVDRGLPGRQLPGVWRGADLLPDRQREDRHDRAHRHDPVRNRRSCRSPATTGP